MIYRILADFVVLIHFLWIVFLIFGAFLGRKYKVIKYFHLGGLGFAFLIQIFGWYCPLTHLEVWLRSKQEPSMAYSGSFIIHYVEKIVYMEIPNWIIFLLTIVISVVSFLIYRSKT